MLFFCFSVFFIDKNKLIRSKLSFRIRHKDGGRSENLKRAYLNFDWTDFSPNSVKILGESICSSHLAYLVLPFLVLFMLTGETALGHAHCLYRDRYLPPNVIGLNLFAKNWWGKSPCPYTFRQLCCLY